MKSNSDLSMIAKAFQAPRTAPKISLHSSRSQQEKSARPYFTHVYPCKNESHFQRLEDHRLT